MRAGHRPYAPASRREHGHMRSRRPWEAGLRYSLLNEGLGRATTKQGRADPVVDPELCRRALGSAALG